MTLSLAPYAVLLPQVHPLNFMHARVSSSSSTRTNDSRVNQHFKPHEIRALSSLVVRHGGSILDALAGDARVRVCAGADAEPPVDVIISARANNEYKATVHPSVRRDSGGNPVAVRAVVILSRCGADETVQLVTSCAQCASVVVAASLDWLFHCCASSAPRSPFLYALSNSLPLSSVRATSSGITIAQRELLVPALASLGATFSADLDERCTHLIVRCGGTFDPAQSPKVAACSEQPLRQYVWIVTNAWLAACQAQRRRVAESQFLPPGALPPAHSSADAWLNDCARDMQADHDLHRVPAFGGSGLLVLPPSSLFLEDEQLRKLRDRRCKAPQKAAHPPPSATRGWWIDQRSAAHVTQPMPPLPYAHVAELMSLSSSDPPPASQEEEPPLPSSQLDPSDPILEQHIPWSPPAGAKAFSQSPASSLSGSRTSQGKRKHRRSSSDGSATAPEDSGCTAERVVDERIVRRGECSFSEFQVRWLGADSDSWVAECDVDPALVAAFRAQRRNHPLPSSSPSMTCPVAAAASDSCTLTSSSATKSSGSGPFSARRGKALKAAPCDLPAREHVSFCSQLTPVALARPSQAADGFLSPVVNGSALAAVTPANDIGGGDSNAAAPSLFCSPAALAAIPVCFRADSGRSSSQSELQSSTGSVTSTQQPGALATPLESQKSSLSVEFPPSFACRLSQQLLAPPCEQRPHNAMDIGDYCVGALPSLSASYGLGLHLKAPQEAWPPLPLVSQAAAAAPAATPETSLVEREECSQAVVDAAADALAADGSARKRRRVVASRNFGRVIVSLTSKDDAMYSNSYLSALGACLSDVNCGAFDVLVIDSLRASKKLLCALAGGKWVVSPDYLHASKKQGVLVQPDPYEYCEEQRLQPRAQNQQRKRKALEPPAAESFVEQTIQVSPSAPRHWRQQLLRAFDGLLVCVDADVLPSRSVMTALLVCGGATVADSLQRMQHLHRNHRAGFVVRPASNAKRAGEFADGDGAAVSGWTVVLDMDILQGLCQPLLHPMPFNSGDL